MSIIVQVEGSGTATETSRVVGDSTPYANATSDTKLFLSKVSTSKLLCIMAPCTSVKVYGVVSSTGVCNV